MDLETPFPFQIVGAHFLAGKKQALLADEMGLGKSAQVVVACDLIGAKDVLVICPANVRPNWLREFQRFSPLDRPGRVIQTGTDRPGPGVNVVSYDLLANDKLRAAVKALSWCVLVIDEAHYLKERRAKRSKTIYGHAGRPGLTADFTWRLSGTPAPNDASELFTHLKSAGLYDRNHTDFVSEFCTGFDSPYGYRITGNKNVDRLKALLAQFMLRRKKDEVMKELPPITFHEVTVERSPVELDPTFYEQWRPLGAGEEGQAKFLAELKTLDTTLKASLNAINTSTSRYRTDDRLSLLESMDKPMISLRRYIGMAKLPAVADIIIQELTDKAYDKIVLFAVHMCVIEELRVRFKKFHPVTLYGGTPAEKRQANIKRFMTDPSCRVFIGNITAAGTGIDGLQTVAHEVGFVEASWVPSDNAQAAMRCHRIGQDKPVRVRFFSCAGSVDEDVNAALRRKTIQLAQIL